MFYDHVFKALNKKRIKYLVLGGIAVNLYGLRRLTRDLDLMIDLSAENLDKFIRIIENLGYKTKVRKNKWSILTAIAFQKVIDEFDRIDVFLKNPIDFKKAYKKRKVFRIDNTRIPCVSLEDLICLKSKGNRIRDWIDVGSLKRIFKIKKEGK